MLCWTRLLCAGIDLIGLDSTLYDQVLDMSVMLGLVPARFEGLSGLDLYFAMARGCEGAAALDMSKYFNTNYHYEVCSFASWEVLLLPLPTAQAWGRCSLHC